MHVWSSLICMYTYSQLRSCIVQCTYMHLMSDFMPEENMLYDIMILIMQMMCIAYVKESFNSIVKYFKTFTHLKLNLSIPF